MDKSQKHAEWKKPDPPQSHTVWFHLYEVQQQANLMYDKRSQKSGDLRRAKKLFFPGSLENYVYYKFFSLSHLY